MLVNQKSETRVRIVSSGGSSSVHCSSFSPILSRRGRGSASEHQENRRLHAPSQKGERVGREHKADSRRSSAMHESVGGPRPEELGSSLTAVLLDDGQSGGSEPGSEEAVVEVNSCGCELSVSDTTRCPRNAPLQLSCFAPRILATCSPEISKLQTQAETTGVP